MNLMVFNGQKPHFGFLAILNSIVHLPLKNQSTKILNHAIEFRTKNLAS